MKECISDLFQWRIEVDKQDQQLSLISVIKTQVLTWASVWKAAVQLQATPCEFRILGERTIKISAEYTQQDLKSSSMKQKIGISAECTQWGLTDSEKIWI